MRSIKLVLVYLIPSSLLVNCIKKDVITETELKSTNTLGDSDYQIYSLILNERFANTGEFVVKQKTNKLNMITQAVNYLKTEMPNIDLTIFTNLTEINDSTFTQDNKFVNLNKSITLVTNEELISFLNPNDVNYFWTEFYKKYPHSGGVIGF